MLLTSKHFHRSRTSLFLLALAFFFAGSGAAAQDSAPLKFASRPSHLPEFTREAEQSPQALKEDDEETPVTVSVSPNPTAGKFLVSLKGSREDRVRVKVTDRHGCVVDNHEVSGQSTLHLGFWYHPGTYQLLVTQGGHTKTIKLEKLKD